MEVGSMRSPGRPHESLWRQVAGPSRWPRSPHLPESDYRRNVPKTADHIMTSNCEVRAAAVRATNLDKQLKKN